MPHLNSKNRIFYGYVSPKEMNGMMIPITLQHQTLNNYCKNYNAVYGFPTGELIYENSYFQLLSLIKKIKRNSHIVMCSIYMLPINQKIFNKIKIEIFKKRIVIHCALENFILRKEKDAEDLTILKKLVKIADSTSDLKIKKLY
tara:strand:+ start:907 stop:1338 length:432 start_codon:yes stop_codon:yes gene_type:complete